MLLDAIVLAGGRSSRLSGEPKAALLIDGHTLLTRTVEAAASARHVVVVGDATALELAVRLASDVLLTREEPPFAGPTAAIGAGASLLQALEVEASDYLLVLSCDMPRVAEVVEALLAALADGSVTDGSAGVIAKDAGGARQYLAAAYRTTAITAALEQHGPDLEGLAVKALVEGLALTEIELASGATDDVDTWEDAARLGVGRAPSAPTALTTPAVLSTPTALTPPTESTPPAEQTPPTELTGEPT